MPLTPDFQKTFETATGGKFRPGNSLTVLQNGDEIFPAMLEAVRGARHSIEFVTFVYWHSRVASEFADALCERARAGVTVRLLIDAVGGAIMSTRTIGQLNRAGVHLAWYRPIRFGYLRRFNSRTHRKILIIDGRVGFTGGVGIADEWNGNASGPKHWRETHVRIDGPACIDLLAGFADEWGETTGEHLTPPALPEAAGHFSILTTPSALGPRPTVMERFYTTAIASASERLWITTAYFVPTPEYVAALCTAAGRSVDVRVLTNGMHTNHKSTLYAGRSNYDVLIHGGVKIYEYRRTMLHAKVLSVDKQFVSLGSANFDNRSLVLNSELNISVVDANLAAKLDRKFKLDLDDAAEVTLAVRRQRSGYHRILEAATRNLTNFL